MIAVDESALRELVKRLVREALAEATAAPVNEYLSVRDAARLASVAQGTIRRWLREGRLAAHSAGRVLRVRRADLERLLATPRGKRPGFESRELSPEELAEKFFRRRP